MKPPAFEAHQAFLRRLQPLTERRVLRRNGPKAFHLYRRSIHWVAAGAEDGAAEVYFVIWAGYNVLGSGCAV